MLAREVHHLRHLRLRNLISIDAADSDAFLMHMKHDARGFFTMFIKEPFEDVNDELHWRIIIVQKKHFVQARPLRLRTRFGNDAGFEVGITLKAVVACHRQDHRVSITKLFFSRLRNSQGPSRPTPWYPSPPYSRFSVSSVKARKRETSPNIWIAFLIGKGWLLAAFPGSVG
jgi:hypothetical protein